MEQYDEDLPLDAVYIYITVLILMNAPVLINASCLFSKNRCYIDLLVYYMLLWIRELVEITSTL